MAYQQCLPLQECSANLEGQPLSLVLAPAQNPQLYHLYILKDYNSLHYCALYTVLASAQTILIIGIIHS